MCIRDRRQRERDDAVAAFAATHPEHADALAARDALRAVLTLSLIHI